MVRKAIDQDALQLPGFESEQVSPDNPGERLGKYLVRGGFSPAMFPDYYGFDEEDFTEKVEALPSEALRLSSPAALRGEIYTKGPNSLREHERAGRYILLSTVEKNKIIDKPESFSNPGQKHRRAALAAVYRGEALSLSAFGLADGRTLETGAEGMIQLEAGFTRTIGMLRNLKALIPHEYYAGKAGLTVHFGSTRTRDLLHGILSDIADSKDWSEQDLADAQLGLDKRLMYGRGRQEIQNKKKAWTDLVRVLGNHQMAKRTLVRDRLIRSKAELDKRIKHYEI